MSYTTVSDLAEALGREDGDAVVVLLVEEAVEHERDGRPVVALELVLSDLERLFRVRLGGRKPSGPVTRDEAYRMAGEYVFADGGRRRRRAVVQMIYADGEWHGHDSVDTRTAWNRRRARSVYEAVTK